MLGISEVFNEEVVQGEVVGGTEELEEEFVEIVDKTGLDNLLIEDEVLLEKVPEVLCHAFLEICPVFSEVAQVHIDVEVISVVRSKIGQFNSRGKEIDDF